MHLTIEQLVDAAEGTLSTEGQAHMATCSRCSSEVARFRHLIELMRSDTSEAPPPAAMARVRGLLRAAPGRAVPRLTAMLRFDSRHAPQGVGLRSGAARERQMLFDAAPFVVDVRLVRSGDQWSIAGQVLGPETRGVVELVGPLGVLSSPLNDACEFVLPPVPTGSYTLTLRLDGSEVVVADLTV